MHIKHGLQCAGLLFLA